MSMELCLWASASTSSSNPLMYNIPIPSHILPLDWSWLPLFTAESRLREPSQRGSAFQGIKCRVWNRIRKGLLRHNYQMQTQQYDTIWLIALVGCIIFLYSHRSTSSSLVSLSSSMSLNSISLHFYVFYRDFYLALSVNSTYMNVLVS